MTAIGPYVVVFWTLSRLVLVRKGCDAAFLLYSQSNMVEQAVTCSCVHSHLVTVPAGYNLLACLTFLGCSPVTRVELELNRVSHDGPEAVAWPCTGVADGGIYRHLWTASPPGLRNQRRHAVHCLLPAWSATLFSALVAWQAALREGSVTDTALNPFTRGRLWW